MGVITSGSLNTTPVHWTQFPAASLTIDWSNMNDAHRAVMRLFPATLPGPKGERRASSGILFRVDAIDGIATVLIQSEGAPELTPPDARMRTVSARAWHFAPGDRVAFRVAVNPLTRGKQLVPNETHINKAGLVVPRKKDAVRGVVEFDDVPFWLESRLEGLEEVQTLNHYRDKFAMSGRKLVIDALDCTATITNPEAFDALRLVGVGRSKAYGCGLLTARRCLD